MITIPTALLAGIASFAYLVCVEEQAREQRLRDLQCLAENVCYESRGEPLVGQYAVAEVTMNRVASGQFPNTVCDVVHAGDFDAAHERFTGAFSWTELESRPEPFGYEWRRARAVAETVYDNYDEAPLVEGALFYHATHVSPTWARTKVQVALIGRHLFYE